MKNKITNTVVVTFAITLILIMLVGATYAYFTAQAGGTTSRNVTSYEEFVEQIKTKRYTYNKINRMLIHILLDLKKKDNIKELDYIKILGFSKNGKKYLNSIKESINIPTQINKESLVYKYELKASIIYDLICSTNTYDYEIKNKPVIID